jgi:hypothetical protein
MSAEHSEDTGAIHLAGPQAELQSYLGSNAGWDKKQGPTTPGSMAFVDQTRLLGAEAQRSQLRTGLLEKEAAQERIPGKERKAAEKADEAVAQAREAIEKKSAEQDGYGPESSRVGQILQDLRNGGREAAIDKLTPPEHTGSRANTGTLSVTEAANNPGSISAPRLEATGLQEAAKVASEAQEELAKKGNKVKAPQGDAGGQ